MSYECEVIDRPAQPVLSVRTRSAVQNLPTALGQAYGAIMQHAAKLGAQPAGAPFVAYYNMDMQDLDIEAGYPVEKPLPGTGVIQPSQIPAGRFATCLYKGPYDQCGSAYEELSTWIKEQGCETTGVAYEFYLNDPAETPPQDLKTQIIFQLKTT